MRRSGSLAVHANWRWSSVRALLGNADDGKTADPRVRRLYPDLALLLADNRSITISLFGLPQQARRDCGKPAFAAEMTEHLLQYLLRQPGGAGGGLHRVARLRMRLGQRGDRAFGLFRRQADLGRKGLR